MVYSHFYGATKAHISKLALLVVAIVFASAAAAAVYTSASAATISGCSFTQSGTTWTLDGDCDSTSQINVPAGTTLDGDGYTISADFDKTSNSNNSVIGVGADDVTIENLTIDSANGDDLHGVNVYVSENVFLDNVTTLNNRSGVVVNGSTVTVNDITTGGNIWHGINVDQGSGVTAEAQLTITGTSMHTDDAHVYLDDTTKDVSVDDVESQYTVEDNVDGPNDRLYTLIEQPSSKQDCKRGGFGAFGFKNQGRCIQFVNTGRDSRQD